MASGPNPTALIKPLAFRNHPDIKIPRVVYGTAWKKDRTATLVYQALKAGFKAIDTAAQPRHYNEAQVGEGIRRAIKEGIVKREDLYVSYALDAKPYITRLTCTDTNQIYPSLRAGPKQYALQTLSEHRR
jgi:diketogulonate reductase-like aldo/keto reductase